MSFKEHEYCSPPQNPHQPIWRYMSFIKFFSLLENNSLFFPKISILPDKYEGLVSKKSLQYLKKSVEKLKDENQQNEQFERLLSLSKKARNLLTVCSWHLNFNESTAMWNVYLNKGEGLAIKSSYHRFINSLSKTKEDVYIGSVEYIDYELEKVPFGNLFATALYKRNIFEYENELRALVLLTKSIKENGIYVKVDLEKLIESIYLSPNTENWVEDLIHSALNRIGLEFSIRYSAVDSDPPY